MESIVHPKMEMLIKRFMSHPNLFIGVEGTDDFRIQMYDRGKSDKGYFGGPLVVGRVDITQYIPDRCLGAYIVTGKSIMDANYNLGPVLYDIALELAGEKGLMSDREDVSSDAFNLWHKYLTMRDDVSWSQLDDWKEKWTPDIIDDCDLHISKVRYASERRSHIRRPGTRHKYNDYKKWATETYEDPLSKVFYKKTTPIIDMLKIQKRIEFK